MPSNIAKDYPNQIFGGPFFEDLPPEWMPTFGTNNFYELTLIRQGYTHKPTLEPEEPKPTTTIEEGSSIPKIYGYYLSGGNIIRGTENESALLSLIVGHCLGPASEALAYYIGDIPFDAIEDNPTKIFYSGTTGQIQDSRFSGVSSTYRGLAYTAFTFTKNNQINDTPSLKVIGNWQKCLEIGGSGTTIGTNNPAQIMYDWYYTVEGCATEELHTSYFQDLALYCDNMGVSGSTAPFRPALGGNTVTATTTFNTYFYPFYAADGNTSKTGETPQNGWRATTNINQRINFDFGQPITFSKVILENYHDNGGALTYGINNFDIRASNDPAAFNNRIVGVGGEIWDGVIFDDSGVSFVCAQHSALNQSDPQEFILTNSTAYRYWSVQIKNGHGASTIGVRDIEFQGYIPKRYTFDYAFSSDISINDAKKMLWESFNGCVIWSQGKLKPVWECAKDISYNFTMNNIVKGSFEWSRPKTYNIIRIMYYDMYNGFQKDVIELKNDDDVLKRGEMIYEEKAYYINNSTVARKRARFLFEEQLAVDYLCKLKGFPGSQGVEIYDRVTVSHNAPGWTNKDFMIMSKEEDSFGFPIFTMKAYYEGLYRGEDAEPQKGYSSNIPNPNATPSQVTGLTVTDASGWASDGWYIPKVNVTYTKPDNSAFWKAANLYLSNDDATWNFAGADYDGTGNVLLTSLANVETGATVFVKALSVNELGIQAPDNESAATKSLFLYLPDIQATFDNIPDGGTGRFIFPKGTYTQTSAVSVPDKRILLYGMQREGVIFVNNSGDQLFKLYNRTKYFEASNFTVSSANTVVFSNMFDVTGSAAVNNTADLNLQNIKFNLVDERDWAVGDGDKAVYGVNGFPRNFRISDCIINKGQQGINFEEYANIKIIGNTLIDQSVSAINILNSGENFLDISNNNIYDQRYSGIFYTTTAENVIIGNNTIQSASDGIYAQFAALLGRVQDALVNNNSITINTSSTTTQLLGIFSILSVNTEYNNNNIIIDVDTELNVYGMSLTDSKSQAINNTIRIDCSDNSMNHYGIKSNAPDCLIANNNIDMNNINAPDSMDIGINIANSITNADNNTVSNNIINNVLDYNMVVVDAGLEGVVVNGTNISGLNMTTNSEHFTKIFSRG